MTRLKSEDNIGKQCSKCKKVKKVAKDYYTHRDYALGNYCDDWCKECVKSFVVDKESLEKYCIENHRVFSEELWIFVNMKVKEKFENNDTSAIGKNTSTKNKSLAEKTITFYFQQMGNTQWYSFDSTGLSSEQKEISNQVKESSDIFQDGNVKIFSPEWGDEYLIFEIQIMDEALEDYRNTYELNPFDLKQVKRLIKTDILAEREFQLLNQNKGSIEKYDKLIKLNQKIAEDTRLNKKQRGVLEGADGRNSWTQLQDDLEKRGVIPVEGCYEEDSLEKLLKCNANMLADIFYGVGYDEQKFKQILGSGQKGVEENAEAEVKEETV